MKKVLFLATIIGSFLFAPNANAQLRKLKNKEQKEMDWKYADKRDSRDYHHDCDCDKHEANHPSHNGKGKKLGHYKCDHDHDYAKKDKRHKKTKRNKRHDRDDDYDRRDRDRDIIDIFKKDRPERRTEERKDRPERKAEKPSDDDMR